MGGWQETLPERKKKKSLPFNQGRVPQPGGRCTLVQKHEKRKEREQQKRKGKWHLVFKGFCAAGGRRIPGYRECLKGEESMREDLWPSSRRDRLRTGGGKEGRTYSVQSQKAADKEKEGSTNPAGEGGERKRAVFHGR